MTRVKAGGTITPTGGGSSNVGQAVRRETSEICDLQLKPSIFTDRQTTRESWYKIQRWRRTCRKIVNEKIYKSRPAVAEWIGKAMVYGGGVLRVE